MEKVPFMVADVYSPGMFAWEYQALTQAAREKPSAALHMFTASTGRRTPGRLYQ